MNKPTLSSLPLIRIDVTCIEDYKRTMNVTKDGVKIADWVDVDYERSDAIGVTCSILCALRDQGIVRLECSIHAQCFWPTYLDGVVIG